MRKPQYVILVLAVSLGAVSASGDVLFDLAPSTLTTSPGNTIEFVGTLTNTGSTPVFLNADLFSFPYAQLKLDDAIFFSDAPLSLPANWGGYSGPFFDISVGPMATTGAYDGSFIVVGGADTNANDDLASQSFTVIVTSTPEPGSIVFLLLGLAIVLLLSRQGLAPNCH